MKKLIVIIFILFASQVWAGEGRIYAQRMSAAGATVGTPIVINSGTTGHTQSQPEVAFYDDRFLVVWQEWNGTDLDIKGARIEMDGTVLDSTPIDIASTSRTDALPDVASDPTGWVVVWHGFEGTSDFPSLYARRVNYNGSQGTTSGPFGDDADYGSQPRIAWSFDEGKFAIVYHSFDNSGSSHKQRIYVNTLTTSLVDTPDTDYITAQTHGTDLYEIAAMPGGKWTYILSGIPPTTYSAKPGQAAINIDSDGGINASGYLVSGNEITDGASKATDFIDYYTGNPYSWGTQALEPDATSGYIIGVWSRYHKGTGSFGAPSTLYDSDLYAGRINDYDLIESMGGTTISATADVNETNPALAGDGAGNLLLTYDKETDGSTEIIGKILTESSGLSAGSEITIRTDTTGTRRSHSAVAYGDDGGGADATNPLFMVVWTEGWWGTL